jgi:hypothetical protein
MNLRSGPRPWIVQTIKYMGCYSFLDMLYPFSLPCLLPEVKMVKMHYKWY